MINYTEKGSGLHEAIRKAGYSLRSENGAWVTDNPKAVQAIIDSYDPLAAEITAAKARIDAHANTLRSKATSDASSAEMATWGGKYSEAKALVSGKDAEAPRVVLEAAAAGVSPLSVAERIVAKGDQLAELEAAIAGTATKHKMQAESMTDYVSAMEYDFSNGWPDV